MNTTAPESAAKAVQTAEGSWVVVCREAGHAILADLGRTKAYVAARTVVCPECKRLRDLAQAEALAEIEAEIAQGRAALDATDEDAVLAEIARHAEAGDIAARNAAIIKGAKAGIGNGRLAKAAGLTRVSTLVREGLGRGPARRAVATPRLGKYAEGYQNALADILVLVDAGKTRDESLLLIEEWVANNRIPAAAAIFDRAAREYRQA